jgi:hypothetical protein
MVKFRNGKKLREILAHLFVLLIGLVFVWSLKKDSRLRTDQMFLRWFRVGMIHYTIHLKSFNPEDETFNVTISVDEGMLPPWTYSGTMKIRYGPLVAMI